MLTFINFNITEFYSYRRAIVDASIWIDLDLKDKNILRNYLSNAGHSMDNHICWKDSDGTCFQYSDGQLGIGTKLIEQKW